MQRPKLKICGLTRQDDVQRAIQLGASYCGFIVVPESPRCVDSDTLHRLLPLVTPPAQAVVVCRNIAPDALRQLLAGVSAHVGMIQMHGHESAEDVAAMRAALGIPVIKAVPVPLGADEPHAALMQPTGADFDLFDTKSKQAFGGTGRAFDWGLLHTLDSDRLARAFLAGGLEPAIIAAAASFPVHALDVSSGVESAPGIKDHAKLAALVDRWRAVAADTAI